MGYFSALDMKEQTDLETALKWHLRTNHYPPVSVAFLPVCKKALEFAESEEFEETIELPNGKILTVGAIIEGLHLTAFLPEQ